MFRVQIDLSMLRERLSKLYGKFTTNGDVFLWLIGHGITIDHGSWIATLPQLRLLELREIISSCPLGWVSDRSE
jgi:hypothetical protein